MPTPGLTARRVSGEKTLCQRYCEDSIADGPSALAFRQNTEVGIPTSVEESRPRRGAGSAGLRCRAGAAGGALGVEPLGEPSNEVGRASTHWASPYWASHRTRLGRAIKRGWGEPSSEVGRASTKGPLGEPRRMRSRSSQRRATAPVTEPLL